MDESKLLYSVTHEWVDIGDDVCTVGITSFAVAQLTDVVYVELPSVGQKFEAGSQFGVVESVKAVSELYAPIAGEVIAVNGEVAADPSVLSTDPYDQGWLIKLKPTGLPDTARLKQKAAYDHQCEAEAH